MSFAGVNYYAIVVAAIVAWLFGGGLLRGARQSLDEGRAPQSRERQA